MISPLSDKTDLIDKLLSVLDVESHLLELRRTQMEELHDLLIHSDEARMERLLCEMEQAQQRQFETDEALASVRSALARAMGRPDGKVRIQEILPYLDEPIRLAVKDRREKLMLQANRLREQHLATTILLSESLRINRILLEGLFPRREALETYDTKGVRKWQKGTGLMDMEY